MVKRLDATYAVTKKLRELFPEADITERKDKIGESNRDSFYVYSRNSLNNYYNKYYNEKVLDIVINYLPQGDETDYMNTVDLIEESFSRFIDIDEQRFCIRNITTQQVKDEHGDFIVFILSIPYMDVAYQMEEYPDNMGGNIDPEKVEETDIKDLMKNIQINHKEGDE